MSFLGSLFGAPTPDNTGHHSIPEIGAGIIAGATLLAFARSGINAFQSDWIPDWFETRAQSAAMLALAAALNWTAKNHFAAGFGEGLRLTALPTIMVAASGTVFGHSRYRSWYDPTFTDFTPFVNFPGQPE